MTWLLVIRHLMMGHPRSTATQFFSLFRSNNPHKYKIAFFDDWLGIKYLHSGWCRDCCDRSKPTNNILFCLTAMLETPV